MKLVISHNETGFLLTNRPPVSFILQLLRMVFTTERRTETGVQENCISTSHASIQTLQHTWKRTKNTPVTHEPEHSDNPTW